MMKKETGWKKACFTSGVSHYFKEGFVLCNTNACFCTAKPEEKPRGYVCKKCLKKLEVLE